jgi:hypothetical protein
LRTSCPHCSLPVIISASDVSVGLPCPRCHRALETPAEGGLTLQRVVLTLAFVVCVALVPSLMVIGDGTWVDQCMDLARGALSR